MKKEDAAALQAVADGIEKDYGKGAIMRLGSKNFAPVEYVPTVSLALDVALGVGGIPKGRVIEIYGPESGGKTTLSLQIISQVQKFGGNAAFIDAEHSLDPVYAKRLGVNVDDMFISQPDNGEQALEITKKLIESEKIAIVVVDSVAALVPRAELEGDMGDPQMGLQARLMSQALRKLTAVTQKSGTILIFINQIREKIGVMFGCVHADTLVNFTDGRSVPIRRVVEKQMSGDVFTYNEKFGRIESQPILDWHFNGETNDWIHIQTSSLGTGGGTLGLTLTPNHLVLTPTGWVSADTIKRGDFLISRYESKFNGTLRDFLSGVLVGDSHVAIRDRNTASLKLQDAQDSEYLAWKLEKLEPAYNFRLIGKRWETRYEYELADLIRRAPHRDPIFFFQHYSDLGLAVWLMDDGHLDTNGRTRYTLSIKRFRGNKEKLNQIVEQFQKRGLACSYNLKNGTILFSAISSLQLAERIAIYVPKCMQRKLPVGFQNRYVDFRLTFTTEQIAKESVVRLVRPASRRQKRQRGKYDISVGQNKNYMVGGTENGIVIHNSPETTTGGRALKFYASVRLDIRKIKPVKEGDVTIGVDTRIKVVKNKVAAPYTEAEVRIYYGYGISREFDLVRIGEEQGVLEKSGTWYSYKGERLGHGADKARLFLMEHADTANALDAELRSKLFKKDDKNG